MLCEFSARAAALAFPSDTQLHAPCEIRAGHTDNQGGADDNLKLSLARTHSVVTWLTQHGISGDILTAKVTAWH
jgi:flagellar motor protein MotB